MNLVEFLRERVSEMDRPARLRWGMGIGLLLLLALLYSSTTGAIDDLARKRVVREADLTELMLLKQRYLTLKRESEQLTNRLATVKSDDSLGRIIEEAGFKGKQVQIRSLKGDERGGVQEESAEVKIDGLTANELVNLLHRLEKGSKPIVMKKLLVKSRFDDPAKVDMTLTVALIRGVKGDKR
jgi:general secretion pathway protein M